MSISTNAERYKPPADSLRLLDGVWQPERISAVSYPEEGNDVCFQVEDGSYWFNHRNRAIVQVLRQFPPSGTLYDIGGGNGFVSMNLQQAGIPTVLVEPGRGVTNAVKRGVSIVIHCTLGDAGCSDSSLDAAGAFDVVEHIDNDVAFLKEIRDVLRPGGRFYCTVRQCSRFGLTKTYMQGTFAVILPRLCVRQLRFDIVLATGLLHHLDDNEALQLFDIAHKVLAARGRLLTIDGVFAQGQNPMARWLIRHDRGKNVRTEPELLALATQCFPATKAELRHDLLRVPYTHIILECTKLN